MIAIAPSGTEIKAGQIWVRGSSWWDVSPIGLRADSNIECYRVSMGKIMTSMRTLDIPLSRFTNKRGGYKLIKEAE